MPSLDDAAVNPLLRNALRVSLSSSEYKLLHARLLKRSSSLPSPSRYESIVQTTSANEHNVAALRASLRVFAGVSGGMSLVEFVIERIKRAKGAPPTKTKISFLRSPKARLALSFSLLLFIHRILYRFFVRLRANLRTEDAKAFRERNPWFSAALTSRYAPVVVASLAGAALGIPQSSGIRVTAAIYMATRSLEFLYNALNEKGFLKYKPWWFGSWLLMPLSFAQLFHAFVFDRETVPGWFDKLLLRFSSSYIAGRPVTLPADVAWPNQHELVDSLGSIAELKWPAFISPTLHPNHPNPLPNSVKSISALTSSAHPNIASLSCALRHSSTPSCNTAFLHQFLNSVPQIGRVVTIGSLLLSLLGLKRSLAKGPAFVVSALIQRILRLTAILSASMGGIWGSICLLNSLLPRNLLPTQRFYISGALGGLPFAAFGPARGLFTFVLRAAVTSAHATGLKRQYWRESKVGELALIVASWALLGVVMEWSPEAVQGAGLRKVVAWLRGDGFVDPAMKRKAKESKAIAGAADVTSVTTKQD